MIVRDPEPAIAENLFVGPADAGSIHHRAKAILAAVNAGIFSGALFDALDKARGLIDPHGPAGIMAVLFEIEDEQDAAWLDGGPAPTRRRRRSENARPGDRVGGVPKMISAPEQSGAQSPRSGGCDNKSRDRSADRSLRE